jgi:ribonucleotide monophosphatase NagD (HAD superfamily)
VGHPLNDLMFQLNSAEVLHRTGINREKNNTELTYDKLKKASIILGQGADLLATHCDVVSPTPKGMIPDIRSILALLDKVTGTKPAKVFWKPNPEMLKHIIALHGLQAEEVVIVGDRIYTDFEPANNIGCEFVLVLSGETKREDIEAYSAVPDLVIRNISALCYRSSL